MTKMVFGLFVRVCACKELLAMYDDVCMLILYMLVIAVP
jgi:hypothetical protein